jgi:hypothetical protein
VVQRTTARGIVLRELSEGGNSQEPRAWPSERILLVPRLFRERQIARQETCQPVMRTLSAHAGRGCVGAERFCQDAACCAHPGVDSDAFLPELEPGPRLALRGVRLCPPNFSIAAARFLRQDFVPSR